MQIKKKHHYIWRKYLKPWSTDNQIFCSRLGKKFQTNLMNIGQEKGFYKLKELTDYDIKIIRTLAIDTAPVKLQSLHNDFLEAFIKISKGKKYTKGFITSQETSREATKIDEALKIITWNFEEDIHCSIENIGADYLDSALKGDVDFFDTDKGFMLFVYFLSVQYMRTKRIKEDSCLALKAKGINIENSWSILSHIFSTNMGYSFYLDRSCFRLVKLLSNEEIRFITTDQPVINIYGTGRNNFTPPSELAFYYPISPYCALLMTERNEYKDISEISLSNDKIQMYNELMLEYSYEQFYASSMKELDSCIKT